MGVLKEILRFQYWLATEKILWGLNLTSNIHKLFESNIEATVYLAHQRFFVKKLLAEEKDGETIHERISQSHD